MEQFYIRKAALFGGKLCVVSLGGFGLWLLCGVAEYPALWWLYALTAALCFVLAALMAALVSLSEDDLKRAMDEYKRVPVRKIERRSSRRHSEDGLARHNREREQAQDLADALQIAASAADDHDKLVSLRMMVNQLAVKAHAAVDALDAPDRASDRDILTDLARNVISTARLYGVDSELPPSRKRADRED